MNTIKYSTQYTPLEFTPTPNNVTFTDAKGADVMRIEKNRIWVNPEVSVSAAAQTVIDAINWALVERDRQIWNEAIDAAAEYVGRNMVSAKEYQYKLEELKK